MDQMIHMLGEEFIGMVNAARFGMANTSKTLLAALDAIGEQTKVVLLGPRYDPFPKVDPATYEWVIDEAVVCPVHLIVYMAPGVFLTGAGDVRIDGRLITFASDWYRGTGVLTLGHQATT